MWLSADDTVDAGDSAFSDGVARQWQRRPDYQIEVTAPFDPLVDPATTAGSCVHRRRRRQLEESDEANNVLLAPNAVELGIAELAVGTPTQIGIASGEVQYLRIAGPPRRATRSLPRRMWPTWPTSTSSAFGTSAGVPSELCASGSRRPPAGPSRCPPATLTWFLRIAGRAGAGTGTIATIEAERLEFGLFSSSPSRGSNLGQATLQISGAGLAAPVTVRLVGGPDDPTSRSVSSTPVDDGHATATLDLARRARRALRPGGRADRRRARRAPRRLHRDRRRRRAPGAVHQRPTQCPARLVGTVRGHGAQHRRHRPRDRLAGGVRGASGSSACPGARRTPIAGRVPPRRPSRPARCGPGRCALAGRVEAGGRGVPGDRRRGQADRRAVRFRHPGLTRGPAGRAGGRSRRRARTITSGEPSTLQFRIRNTGSTPFRGPWTLDAGLVGEPELFDGALVVAPHVSELEPVEVGTGDSLDPGESLDTSAVCHRPIRPTDQPAGWSPGRRSIPAS